MMAFHFSTKWAFSQHCTNYKLKLQACKLEFIIYVSPIFKTYTNNSLFISQLTWKVTRISITNGEWKRESHKIHNHNIMNDFHSHNLNPSPLLFLKLQTTILTSILYTRYYFLWIKHLITGIPKFYQSSFSKPHWVFLSQLGSVSQSTMLLTDFPIIVLYPITINSTNFI